VGATPRLRVIQSIFGHDSFLKEPQRIGAFIRDFLDEGR
jgi:homoserine acetyltransferase